MKKYLVFLAVVFSGVLSAQQKYDRDLPKGNEAFGKKDFSEAEADYRISHSRNPQTAAPAYNLGNAIYRQKQVAESESAYKSALEKARTHDEKHRAYHNLGNVYMTEKNYSAAVEAYKNALRNNPADEQTRYNYALAKKMLKDNPPPKDNKDKKKDKKNQDKKDQDKKKQDQKDKDKDKQDQKQGNKPQPKDQQDQGQPKPKPGGIPKQRLENLLDAVNNEEKKVQDKVNAKKVKGVQVQNEKDW
jgi:tetratricopeptide (TPR) repeat protein